MMDNLSLLEEFKQFEDNYILWALMNQQLFGLNETKFGNVKVVLNDQNRETSDAFVVDCYPWEIYVGDDPNPASGVHCFLRVIPVIEQETVVLTDADPNEGMSGGGTIGDDELFDPCKKLTNIEDLTTWLNMLASTKNYINDSDEVAYLLTRNTSGSFNYYIIEGSGASVAFSTDSWIGGMHTHPSGGLPTLSIFSPSDILSIVLNSQNIQFFDFTFSLTTHGGTVYTLIVADWLKFADFSTRIKAGVEKGKDFDAKNFLFENYYTAGWPWTKIETPPAEALENFLFWLDTNNTGLGLISHDYSDLSNMSRMSWSGFELRKLPCE